MISTFIAIAVLLASAVLLIALRPRAERDIAISARAARITGSMPVASTDAPDAAAALAAAEAVGGSMIQAGYSVETVQDVLRDIAHVNNLPESEVLVFPNALLVSARGQGQHRTGAVAGADGQLLLSQIDEVQRTVDAARTGVLDPASTVKRIERIRDMPPTYGRVVRVIGYAFLSGALSVLLGASWTGVSLSAALGLITGAALLLSERVPRRYGALITVGIAFVVAVVVFSLLRAGWGSGILAALLAPLVVLLPGALLTTAVLELSMGHMISGAGRAAAGAMQLVLLSAGIVTAGALVGVPDFDFARHPDLLGPVAPWIAVAVFGISISVHRCAPRRAIPWILLVLYIAYAAQVLGDVFLGGVVSAFVGALCVTPVTALVARQPTGPAALVSFTPAFSLLVPGAIGLVGVADVLGGDRAAAASLVATLSTMVAIALGVLAGSSLSNRMRRPAL
ncbi:threonine/serine exporter family protein [Microbacterium sp. DT81.1]|uniref:threonine/serine exporter family protein n=1 Tax=Microbacterium sp. DT81.1 TaxID=3393413 RepID=UPI003CFADB48